MMIRLTIVFLLATFPAWGEVLTPARTIPAQTVIGPGDIVQSDLVIPGALTDPAAVIGMETRVALYPGRPILVSDIGLPAIVERNALVRLIYASTGLHIATEGRALDRAGPGDVIRVMNLSSRTTVIARIGTDGAAYVSQ